jgi:hypothetical protein
MKIFLLDLMHDLREKRLWPVALVLVIALVAVPVVLSKPAPTPPPPDPAPQEARSEQDLKGLAKVVLAKQDEGKGSELNLFDTTNPFKPPKGVLKKDEGETGTTSTGTGPSTGTGVGNAVTGGSEAGGFGGGGETTPTQPQTPSTTQPKTTQFTYVVDLKWTHGNNTRKVEGMQRLEMLPNENAPLLVFLGVDAKANNAVFMVDSSIKPTGEGKCKPSADDCSFLYLGSGSEELLTAADGKTYTLQILEIRKVEVKKQSSKVKAGSVKRSHTSQKQAAAEQSSDRAESAGVQRRPFLPRLLNELVAVSNDDSAASRPAGPSR